MNTGVCLFIFFTNPAGDQETQITPDLAYDRISEFSNLGSAAESI
jgi:hypothetical protein